MHTYFQGVKTQTSRNFCSTPDTPLLAYVAMFWNVPGSCRSDSSRLNLSPRATGVWIVWHFPT